ncbi:MAG: hypothetical protein HIU87_13570 [Acidobacteria bacterium]|nr:hypothetical protein [Acidobacteriota bacterium]
MNRYTSLIMLLCLCTWPAYGHQAPGAAKTVGCGSGNVKFDVALKHTNGTLNPDSNAVVYVIQDVPNLITDRFAPSTSKIGLDSKWVGANKRRSHFGFVVTPGEHHLCISGQWSAMQEPPSTVLDSFAAQPGHSYYFRVRLLGSFPGPHTFVLDLQPVDADEGEFLLNTSMTSEPHPR